MSYSSKKKSKKKEEKIMWTEQQLRAGIDNLTLDQLVGQTLCYSTGSFTDEQYDQLVRRTMPGSVFHGMVTEERKAALMRSQNKYCPVPTMFVADVENGTGAVAGGVSLPYAMAWGAADDPDLIRRAHHAVALRCRQDNLHMALAPVVDINYNFRSSVLNVRAVSDSPDQVIKMTRAAVDGFQQDNVMAACCKHFPGDGMDERNQHFMTTVNSMSREEWMDTYGRVYREMIKAGTMAIMVAHIALPAFDEKIDDYLGYPPATLSKNLMTGLLKGELGFDGCIVSDALSMIGACSMMPSERLAVEYLKAGGDMLLFPLPSDFDCIKAAVESGELPIERLKDAVLRIWRIKNQVGLFDRTEPIQDRAESEISSLAQEIAEKAITVVRDADGLVANVKLKPGDKVLHVCSFPDTKNAKDTQLSTIEEELKSRGIEVTTKINPGHYEIKACIDDFDYVLVSICFNTMNNGGGSMRISWSNAMTMWRAYLLKNPRVIMASFGDPYKLYDYPYMRTYLNCYDNSANTQRAYVRLLTGEIKARGKSPISFDGFFERETD
ncbi:MAG: glycoside hydrolase family 3 protein [Ruminococcaceae bacterium]|nr:glycoside hydrolase family 3 protein [Oscillospiraceae bacterium]